MLYAKTLLAAFNKVLSKKFGLGELVVLGIIATSTISYALAWQAPAGNPPTGNTDTPLNTGATAQYKSGGLLLNTGGAEYGLIVQNGNVGIGTANPQWKLDVVGGSMRADGYVRGGQLCIGDDCRSSWLASGNTPIYQCPSGDPDYPRNMCVNQLSTGSSCLFASGGCPSGCTTPCTFVGYLVSPAP